MKYPKNRIEAAYYLAGTGETVLDVGCGYGNLLYKLKDSFDKLYGVEINKTRVEKAKELLKDNNFEIIETTVESANFPDEYFDVVVSSDVIEHIIDVFSAFKEMARILKKGGKLIVITPNIADIRRRLTLLFGKFPSTSASDEGFGFNDGTEIFDGGHVHYFTFSALEKLYERYGIANIKRYGFGRFGRAHNILPSLLSPSCAVVGIK
ncbi:MAG TPA: class I SAM-dependent methyltransferase [Spirochaetota bacterium]|nr:MAG: putative methyltransferase YcgJ [Spirochaetes bacterium ADurb.Bin133]HNZ28105.1 class I SAM-dependent methyltransferase [Spirochaetota bacterium]HPY87534.1 class I SAM-dependent methyltransferase [Spirochaetota bacterium]HQB61488.1 class I SAM-dependent methyltransferase [Spirochaetota bacterium]